MRNKISLFVAALSFAAMQVAQAAEMPFIDILKPDRILVDGAADSAGRVKLVSGQGVSVTVSGDSKPVVLTVSAAVK